MSTTTGVIDIVTTPPLASLQQVLDTGGPYAGGDHTLSSFTTNGAFLLPAGTYNTSGTYGVIVQASVIPAAAGRVLGWNDAAFAVVSGDEYLDRIAQVCLVRTLPISGAKVLTDTFDVHLPSQLLLWNLFIGAGADVGLHVFPGFSVDLYYMCVL